jgi:branched-chain amino acid transport system substrate-binding protein
MGGFGYLGVLMVVLSLFMPAESAGTENDAPILVGLDADMSSGSARSGEAIRRGIVLAMDDINGRGGVLGRPLALVVRDHRGNPARGLDNMAAFAGMKDLVAVVGGLHTPVAMAELEFIHKNHIIYLDPWAAGTRIVENGYRPNYVFRVSVRDEYAGGFLIGKALDAGHEKIALLLEQTGWGRSNERSMTEALKARGLEPATVQWFHWGSTDLTQQIQSIRDSGADVILLVANAPEGVAAVTAVAKLPRKERLPIISHWGITGGDFFEKAIQSLQQVDLVFLQTFSPLDPPFPQRARQVFDAYGKKFPECPTAEDIFAPAGTAHAWDLIHLLALAVEKAGSTHRPAVRTALEHLDTYAGLVRTYAPPFTPERHDALSVENFRLARYNGRGVIVPIQTHYP